MGTLRESVVPALVGAALTGVGALVVSIYVDFLPTLLPALQGVAAKTYVKIVLLLLLLLICTIALAVVLYVKSRPFRPRALAGKDFGFKWSAEIDYTSKRKGDEIELQWLCPKHNVFLGIKSAEIPETTYYRFWCQKCDAFHDMISGGAPVYVQEAEKIVKRKILARLGSFGG
jgi:hypothetical protein